MKNDLYKNDQPENHTGYLMWQVSNLRQRIINTQLKELELTYPQFVILSGIHWLNNSGERVNQVRLISFTKMDKSVVSSVLKSLEKRNVVIRDIDPKDTRAKILKISDAGNTQLQTAMKLINEIDGTFFDSSNTDIHDLNKALINLIKENQ